MMERLYTNIMLTLHNEVLTQEYGYVLIALIVEESLKVTVRTGTTWIKPTHWAQYSSSVLQTIRLNTNQTIQGGKDLLRENITHTYLPFANTHLVQNMQIIEEALTHYSKLIAPHRVLRRISTKAVDPSKLQKALLEIGINSYTVKKGYVEFDYKDYLRIKAVKPIQLTHTPKPSLMNSNCTTKWSISKITTDTLEEPITTYWPTHRNTALYSLVVSGALITSAY